MLMLGVGWYCNVSDVDGADGVDSIGGDGGVMSGVNDSGNGNDVMEVTDALVTQR